MSGCSFLGCLPIVGTLFTAFFAVGKVVESEDLFPVLGIVLDCGSASLLLQVQVVVRAIVEGGGAVADLSLRDVDGLIEVEAGADPVVLLGESVAVVLGRCAADDIYGCRLRAGLRLGGDAGVGMIVSLQDEVGTAFLQNGAEAVADDRVHASLPHRIHSVVEHDHLPRLYGGFECVFQPRAVVEYGCRPLDVVGVHDDEPHMGEVYVVRTPLEAFGTIGRIVVLRYPTGIELSFQSFDILVVAGSGDDGCRCRPVAYDTMPYFPIEIRGAFDLIATQSQKIGVGMQGAQPLEQSLTASVARILNVPDIDEVGSSRTVGNGESVPGRCLLSRLDPVGIGAAGLESVYLSVVIVVAAGTGEDFFSLGRQRDQQGICIRSVRRAIVQPRVLRQGVAPPADRPLGKEILTRCQGEPVYRMRYGVGDFGRRNEPSPVSLGYPDPEGDKEEQTDHQSPSPSVSSPLSRISASGISFAELPPADFVVGIGAFLSHDYSFVCGLTGVEEGAFSAFAPVPGLWKETGCSKERSRASARSYAMDLFLSAISRLVFRRARRTHSRTPRTDSPTAMAAMEAMKPSP